MKNITANKTNIGILASACLMAMNTNAADEAALYDNAPADSAFVRLINNDGDKAVSAKVGEKLLVSKAYCQASDYEYVTAGNYELMIDDKDWAGHLQANKSYTFVVNETQLAVIEEDVFNNPKKGQFSTYNLTDKDSIAVKTKDGKKAVFPEVPGNAYVSREVNPIKIGLSVYEADKPLADIAATRFQRGQSNNLFVCGSQNTYQTSWALH